MQNVKQALDQIERLTAGYPAPGNVDARQRLSTYLTAIEDFEPVYIRRAVDNFLKARVPGHNPDFCPSPSRLADETRRILVQDLDAHQMHTAAVKQIEQREEIFHAQPPELRKMAVAAGLARLHTGDPLAPPKDPEAEARAAAARIAAHDARFVDPSDEAIKARLLKPRA